MTAAPPTPAFVPPRPQGQPAWREAHPPGPTGAPPEPLAFSDAARQRIAWLRTRYPQGHERALLLPVLSLAQREFGWVSPQVVQLVAETIPVPAIQVEEVATFYTMYNRRPTGRHHIQVCHNICCALVGAEQLVQLLERRLGIRCGETTPDGRFTLSTAECLGACGYGPMMQVNDTYHENLRSREAVERVLDELAALPDRQGNDENLWYGPGTGPGRTLPRDGASLTAGSGVSTPGDNGSH